MLRPGQCQLDGAVGTENSMHERRTIGLNRQLILDAAAIDPFRVECAVVTRAPSSVPALGRSAGQLILRNADLNRWARNRAVRTENTAVTRLWAEQRTASGAAVKRDAGVLGHGERVGVPARGASQLGNE